MPWKDWWEKEKGGETKHMVKRSRGGGVVEEGLQPQQATGSQSQRGR